MHQTIEMVEVEVFHLELRDSMDMLGPNALNWGWNM